MKYTVPLTPKHKFNAALVYEIEANGSLALKYIALVSSREVMEARATVIGLRDWLRKSYGSNFLFL